MPVPYKLAESVNSEVNNCVTPATDAAIYGKPEFWEPAVRIGDCEDYALAKRGHLLAVGCHPADVALCICRDENGDGHCVLAVNTDRGWRILDNRRTWPVVPSTLPYQWESMLCDGVWRELSGW